MKGSKTTLPKIVTMTEIVLPSHANALGTIFGGVVMAWIDIAGAIAAQRFARSPVVTVSIDYLHFIMPIHTGYTVQIMARVTWAGRTSMEVECRVDAENSITQVVGEATHAYLTYVAVNKFGKPTRVPSLIPKNSEEIKLFKEAEKRRKFRLKFGNPG